MFCFFDKQKTQKNSHNQPIFGTGYKQIKKEKDEKNKTTHTTNLKFLNCNGKQCNGLVQSLTAEQEISVTFY